MQYNKANILVLQFEYVFQYLFSQDGEIYQDHISLVPGLYKRILWKLGIIKSPYTQQEIEDGEKALLSGAMKTYDTINAPDYRVKRLEAIRKAKKKAKLAKKDKSCTWQTTEANDGKMIYWCITHGIGVSMVDGEQPTHK